MVLLKTLIEQSKEEQRKKRKTKRKIKRKKYNNKKVKKQSEKTITGITNLHKYKNKNSKTGYYYIYRINKEEYKNQDIWEIKKIIQEKQYPWKIEDYYYIRKLVRELDTNIYELIKGE